MYPFVRLFVEMFLVARMPRSSPLAVHVSHHRIRPWDMDMFLELNNGRTLTLYDLGRLGLGVRSGLMGVLKEQNWGLTVAGSSVRYRRRVRMFQKVEMRSRLIAWDDRFMYFEQSMWRKGECASHILLRIAVTDQNGIVPTSRVANALRLTVSSPEIPDWVKAWSAAESQRPWPPMS